MPARGKDLVLTISDECWETLGIPKTTLFLCQIASIVPHLCLKWNCKQRALWDTSPFSQAKQVVKWHFQVLVRVTIVTLFQTPTVPFRTGQVPSLSLSTKCNVLCIYCMVVAKERMVRSVFMFHFEMHTFYFLFLLFTSFSPQLNHYTNSPHIS